MSIKITIKGVKVKNFYGEAVKGKATVKREVKKLEELKAEVEKARKEEGLEKVGEVTIAWDDNQPEDALRGAGDGGGENKRGN